MAIGRDVIVEETTDGGTTWNVIAAGERSNSISISGEAVDLTDKSSAGWRQLDTRASLLTVEVTMSGTVKDDTLIERIMTNGDNLTFNSIRLVLPNFGTFAGDFYMSGLNLENPHDDAQTFEGTFMSAGVITWTPAP